MILFLLPAAVFLLSFIPFISALTAIKQNVIGYQLNHGQTLIYKLGELIFPHFLTDFDFLNGIPFSNAYKPLWIISLFIAGYILRKDSPEKILLVYLSLIVALSPAISEQYFLIPLIAAIYLRKHLVSWLYIALGSYYLLFVSAHNTAKYFNLGSLGLQLDPNWTAIGFAQIQILLLMIAYQLLKPKIKESY
ncbi:MAG: hypothetical protein IT245_05655 [Bacteroidia bacterium]|nr:hypothetical protein [Bacteroidia bacterium]